MKDKPVWVEREKERERERERERGEAVLDAPSRFPLVTQQANMLLRGARCSQTQTT